MFVLFPVDGSDIVLDAGVVAGVAWMTFFQVKKWLTLNEPWSFIHHGYSSGMHAPGRCSDR